MRKIHLILALALMCPTCLAAGLMQWNRTFGGISDDGMSQVIQSADGGYLSSGWTTSFGVGGNDIWAVKADSNGNHQWNLTFGGAGDDGANSGMQTADGGYIISGWTTSFGAGSYDFILIKLNSTGGQEWNRTYGGTGDDEATFAQQTADGGYMVAGFTDSFGAGSRDVWLIKTDSSGNHQWNVTFGGAASDEAWSAQQTADGGYILAGQTTSFAPNDFWLIKTDAAGAMQWNATFGGPGLEQANSVRQTADGGYALAGYTTSFGAGSYDAWLVKTDSAGAQQWNSTYGNTGGESAGSVRQTADGGYVLGAYSNSFGAGGYDYWLIRTNSTGSQTVNATYGGAANDFGVSAQQTSDNGYILGGYTSSFGAGGSDFWLVKIYGDAVTNPVPSCALISAPGSYQLTNNSVGANISASPMAGFACIKIAAPNVVFDCNGFNITNNVGGQTFGVLANGSSSNVTIQNCPGVSDYYISIDVDNSPNATVVNNNVLSADQACIQVTNSDNSVVSNNTVNYCTNFGVSVGSNRTNMTGNTVLSGGTATCFYLGGSYSLAKNNTGSYCTSRGMEMGGSNLTALLNVIYYSSYYGFYINNVLDSLIANNTAYRAYYYGFIIQSGTRNCLFSDNYASLTQTSFGYDYAVFGQDNNLTHNTAYTGNYGMYCISDNNTFFNNTISNARDVFNLAGCTNSTFAYNFAYGSTNAGFRILSGSNNNMFLNNNHQGSIWGHYIDSSGNNTIINDTEYGCTNTAFYLTNATSNNFSGVYSNSCPNGFYLTQSYYNTIDSSRMNNTNGAGYYVTGGAGNTFTNDNASYVSNFGGFDLETTSGNMLMNNTVGFAYVIDAFRISNSTYNTVANSTVYNSSVGYRLLNSSNNSLYGNYVANATTYGFWLQTSTNNTVTDSVSQDNVWFDLMVSAVNESDCNNNITNMNGSGGRPVLYSNNSGALADLSPSEAVLCNADYSTVSNVTVMDSPLRRNNMFLLVLTDWANISYSSASGSFYGFYLVSSSNNNISNSSSSGNAQFGLYLSSSNGNNVSGSTFSSNSPRGAYILNSSSTFLSQNHYFNNSADVYVSAGSPSMTVALDKEVFDNNMGTFSNFTSLSLSDNVSPNSIFTIDWIANTATLPYGYISFAQKYVNISNSTANVTLDSVTWNWQDSQLSGYNESFFEVWKFNSSGPSNLSGVTRDTVANTLTIANLSPASTYGILQNNMSSCPLISLPGSYTLTQNSTGAPQNAIPEIGGFACIKIAASDVYLDCAGNYLVNDGTANAAGILINGSAISPRTNVTVANCNFIGYKYGAYFKYANFSALYGSTVLNGTNSGVVLDSSHFNTMSWNSVFNESSYGFMATTAVSGNNITYNNASFDSQGGFYFNGGSGNTFSNNIAWQDYGGGFFLYNLQNGTISYNNASSPYWYGFYINNAKANLFLGNNATNSTYYGYYLSGGGNNYTNNTAFNNSYGFYLWSSSNNNFTNNSGNNNTNYGFELYSGSSSNNFTNNSANGNKQSGFYFYQASGNNFTNNFATRNTQYGFFAEQSSVNNLFMGNTAFNNSNGGFYNYAFSNGAVFVGNNASYGSNGFYIGGGTNYVSVINNTVSRCSTGIGTFGLSSSNITGNLVLDSGNGFYVHFAGGIVLNNNTAAGNQVGYYIDASNYNTIANGTAFSSYGSSNGVYVYSSTGTNITNVRLYNNSGADLALNAASVLRLTNVTMDNPYGSMQNYTALNLTDSSETGSYAIEWTANDYSYPPAYVSFAQKFANMTLSAGAPVIDSVTWTWLAAESSGYNEARFHLLKRNASGWVDQNATLDTAANTLSMTNVNPGSTYAILQNNDTTAPNVALNSPADGNLTGNSSVQFVFTAVDAQSPPMNCSLYIDGAFNDSLMGIANNTVTTFNETLTAGNHSWYIACTDASNNTNSSPTRTLFLDTIPPNIRLNFPGAGYSQYVTGATTLQFNFTATDDRSTSMNCSLWTDSTQRYQNDSVLNGTDWLVNVTLDPGVYNWYVMCTDTQGNSNSSLSNSLTLTVPAPPSSGPSPALPELSLSYSIDQPNNQVTISTSSGAYIRLLLLDPYAGTIASATADLNGEALFTLTQNGTYEAIGTKGGYTQGSVTFDFTTYSPPAPQCYYDSDCPANHTCQNGACIALPSQPPGNETKPPEHPPEPGQVGFACTADDGCNFDQYCSNITKTCLPVPGRCGYPLNHRFVNYSCCNDSDCGFAKGCREHTCVEISYALIGSNTGYVGDTKTVGAYQEGGKLPNAQVRVTSPDGTRTTVNTDSSGNLNLALEQEGTYTVELLVNGTVTKTLRINSLGLAPAVTPPRTTILETVAAAGSAIVLIALLAVIGFIIYWYRFAPRERKGKKV